MENENRREIAVGKLSDFINASAGDQYERAMMHDYLSFLEEKMWR